MYKQYYTLLLKGYSLKQVADMMGEEYEKVRKGIYRFARDNNLPTASEIQNLSFEGIETAFRITNKEKSEEEAIEEFERKFTEEITTKEDGEVTSTKLISQSDLASEESILLSHGINPEEFTLTSHRQSKWDNAGGEQRYSSRVTVKPKKLEITQEELLDKILNKIDKLEPYRVEYGDEVEHNRNTLVIPLYDLHFQYTTEEQKGHTSKFYYRTFLYKIRQILCDKKPEEVVIIFGGDALEHDNFVFTTESGTRTDDTSLDQDYVALYKFLDTLVNTIFSLSKAKIKFIYVRGNHSPSMDWALTHALKQKYVNLQDFDSSIVFDLSLDTLKFVRVYDSFIGLKHGHINSREREADTLVYLNPKEYAECKYHYMFTGHYHRIKEYVVDRSSIFYIQFPSPAINNNWAKDLQFNSQFSGLRITLFEPNQGITQDYYIRAKLDKEENIPHIAY